MSIKPIETQMMITRSTELSRDVSSEADRTALRSEYQAAQARALQEKERTSIKQTEETEKSEFQVDKDSRGGGTDSRQRGKKKRKASAAAEENKLELSVGSGDERNIDITI